MSDDLLNQVYCPGCGERLDLINTGCPHCGYEDSKHGRILTIREMCLEPTYPEPGSANYQDVCPKFIAAVVAAARA